MKRKITYNGQEGQSYYLSQTDDLIVIRFKSFQNDRFLSKAEIFSRLVEEFTLRLEYEFEGSFVFLFRVVNGSGDMEGLKNEIKDRFKDVILYVGSVLEFEHSKVFQIYTENIFIKFSSPASVQQINRFLTGNSLIVKRDLKISDHAFFVEAATSHGREIFDFCDELLSHPLVDFCHPELVTKLNDVNRSPEISSARNPIQDDRWWIKRVGLDKAHELTKGEGALISVIDDGIEMLHPAFEGRIFHARDMVSEVKIGDASHEFNEFHGTSCSSVAASASELCPGVAPQARIMPIRITGLGSIMQSEAIVYAVNQGADVISCSWGPPDGNINLKGDDNMVFPLPDHTRLAFEYAAKHGRKGKGATIVFAGGNGNEPVANDGYASAKEVIAITSVNHKNLRSHYADFGYPVFCAFPSGDFTRDQKGRIIEATGLKTADRIGEFGLAPGLDFYDRFSGTSASCPGVAGVVALMYSLAPQLSDAEIRRIIKHSCEPVGDQDYTLHDGRSEEFGFGLLRADFALANTLNFINNKPFTKPKPLEIMSEKKAAVSLHIGINDVDSNYYKIRIPKLNGCVSDMNKMSEFATELGFESTSLGNEKATIQNIEESIIKLGNSIEPGGIFLISFAGHGVQFKNRGGENFLDEETDGLDESWVTYDGFMVDDRVFNALAKIDEKVRVVLVSDSCHSEGMSRFIDPEETDPDVMERKIPEEVARKVLELNGQSVQGLYSEVGERSTGYSVAVINLSACLSSETAKETPAGGRFTNSLLKVYHSLKQKEGVNYHVLINLIVNDIRGQRPNITFSHRRDPLFENEPPFLNGKPAFDPGIAPLISQNADEGKPQLPNRYFYESLIKFGSDKNGLDRDQDFTGSRAIEKSSNPWDLAYEYFIQKNGDNLEYVEPDIHANIFAFDDRNQESRALDDYLSTYPTPDDFGSESPFVWHLDHEHSQLRKACEKVFPKIKQGLKSVDSNVVSIAIIDTGYIPKTPTTPLNMEKGWSAIDGSPADVDKKIYVAENQGHGNATMAILAGNWVDLEDTDNAYRGFFGAIPYARILPIRISDTVALLSGRNFAKAVDYAISKGCDVISMSMAGLPSKVMAEAVNRAYEAGIVIVSAAGNNFGKGSGRILPDRTLFPARYDRVISAVGAAINHKPYLLDYHQTDERFAGGEFMQTNYGPGKVLPHSLAAYTPNIMWFGEDGSAGSYVRKSGGGTSSATPQIAAAAALYVQKHREALKEFKGKNAWKKAEIVRIALFNSAYKISEYEEIYGQGILRAYDALADEFAPAKILASLKKAKKAPEKRRFLGGILSVLMNRGIGSDQDQVNQGLKEMMANEISQLIYTDPSLFYLQNTSMSDDEEIEIPNDHQFAQKINKSPYASDFLKSQMHQVLSREGKVQNLRNSEFNNIRIPSHLGDISINSRGLELRIIPRGSHKEIYDESEVWVDEIELTVESSRSLRSGASREIELIIEVDNLETCLLMEDEYEDGTVIYEWKSPVNERGSDISSSGLNRYMINYDQEMQRGLFKKVVRRVIKIVKWVKKKVEQVGEVVEDIIPDLISKFGDKKYQTLVFDLNYSPEESSKKEWVPLSSLPKATINQIESDTKPVLLLFPGLFSTVEKGFDEFFDQDEVRKRLKKVYSRYVIGFNMPTVIQGIKGNSEGIHKMLKEFNFNHRACSVLTRSRGGLVARYLFEDLWVKNNFEPINKAPFKLNDMIMIAPPNQGTKIASDDNFVSMMNSATNVCKMALGTIAPVVPTILTIFKVIGNQVINLHGINDLEEGSELITKLNNRTRVADNYFVVASDFDADKMKILHETVVDKAIFKGEPNDTINPLNGAFFNNPEMVSNITLIEANTHIPDFENRVNHFAYLRPENVTIVDKVLKFLKT